jgi:hypothetical protein
MKRILTSLAAAAVAVTMLSVPVSAEMAKAPSNESTVDKVKNMTRAEWMKLQAGYKKQKAKYTACNNKAKTEKLRGRKRWGSIYDCMTAG